jgi:UDP-N-acetylmuramyl pentapeptide phosphotransferase/UDP-N-acetylglucosamine-1-phosphate transferase
MDKPNERSSHDYITIRGGGIVFWLAGTIYSLFHFPESLYFLTGLTLICGVSFWDDIASLPNKIRIVIHFLSISFVFYGLNLYAVLPWYLILAAYIFFVGVLNAYNFMDGINGITGLYSLAVLIALQYVNYNVQPFAPPDFITYAIIACLVFLFFNCRKKAKCFAGDVGSLGISFWIVLLILQLTLASGSLIWLFFLSVYGVDSIHTLLHRLYLRQNIFKAHRLHFYQILSNDRKIAHWKVSSSYALIQLSVNGLIIYFYTCRHPWTWPVGVSIVGVLSLIYWIKPRLMQNEVPLHGNNTF